MTEFTFRKVDRMSDSHLSALVMIRDHLVEQRRSFAQRALENKDRSDAFERDLSLMSQVQGQIDLIDRILADESQGADAVRR